MPFRCRFKLYLVPNNFTTFWKMERSHSGIVANLVRFTLIRNWFHFIWFDVNILLLHKATGLGTSSNTDPNWLSLEMIEVFKTTSLPKGIVFFDGLWFKFIVFIRLIKKFFIINQNLNLFEISIFYNGLFLINFLTPYISKPLLLKSIFNGYNYPIHFHCHLKIM